MVANRQSSGIIGMLRKAQSAIFMPFNFVATVTAGVFAQGFRNISVIAASFTKKWFGRELHWDPMWKKMEEMTNDFYKSCLNQLGFAVTETMAEIQEIAEQTVEETYGFNKYTNEEISEIAKKTKTNFIPSKDPILKGIDQLKGKNNNHEIGG